MQALKPLRELVILDEVPRRLELFPVLRLLAGRPGRDGSAAPPARFLVLGSASPDLLQQTSESLAGRIYYYQLDGLVIGAAGAGQWRRLWPQSGFPPAFLAQDPAASL